MVMSFYQYDGFFFSSGHFFSICHLQILNFVLDFSEYTQESICCVAHFYHSSLIIDIYRSLGSSKKFFSKVMKGFIISSPP